MPRDFSIEKYKQIITQIINSEYRSISLKDFLSNKNSSGYKFVILRHDIDTKYDLPIALEMAKFEAQNNITASYYFRTVPETLDLNVIKEIVDLGHEIGYHYEVMSLAKGNEREALIRFRKDLELLRTIYPVKTICQHGGAMGHYNTTSIKGLFKIGWDYLRGKIKKIEYYPSLVLWEKYKFEDFGLIGDAYLSIDFKKVKYFSDTGQRWDSFNTRIMDNIDEGDNNLITARTSNDLINIIKSGKLKQLNLLVHPANWHDNLWDWIKWRILQKIRNTLKKLYNPKVNK